jgi:predicted transcriptional regulator
VTPNMPYFEYPIAFPDSPIISELVEPAITVNADGTIDVRHNYALGGTAGSTTLGAGVVTLRNVTIVGEPLIASGFFTGGELPGSALISIGINSWSGPVTLNTNLVIAGGDMAFTGAIFGNGGLGCYSGGTMRLGAHDSHLVDGSRAMTAYRKPIISERHRHRYEFNPKYRERLEQAGLVIASLLGADAFSRLAAEAIEKYLDDNAWQVEAIEEGLRAADDGGVVSHGAVVKWVKSWGKPHELKPPR